ncbi:MAG: glycosyltransferase family 2 protein [Propionibacteriaceae bacterium]|nr:glycosyltransferase family 2 protein [Propionibacteriaceae bacterium]
MVPEKVIAVVVSYNRPALLGECLDALATQTRPVDAVLVVDNASTDDAALVAARHPSHPHLVVLTQNIGGAGGFATGMDLAVRRFGATWVWLMDDDTIPTRTALDELLKAGAGYGTDVDILASKAVWIDGVEHPMNTARPRWRASSRDVSRARAVGATPLRTTSFVSMLVSAQAVERVGLPVADFFIWNDDFEFSARVLRRGTGLYVPASQVVHKTAAFAGTDIDPGDRFFFEVRNKVWTFSSPQVFSPLDWCAYVASTLRRWVTTWRKSTNRARLLDAGLRGLRAGMTTRPRPTGEVLAQAIPQAMPDQLRP